MERMNILSTLFLGLLALTAVADGPAPSATPSQTPSEVSSPAPRLAELPEVASRLALFRLWVEDQQAYLGQPGISIGIVHDQELVWAEGFGLADLESRRPATARTLYRIGSISKTFTATALLKLRDEGRLRLDDPVTRHLPELHLPSHPAGTEITLWHLLTHTSGLPREAPFPYWTDRRFPTVAELFAGLGRQELLFEPGTGYQYSNAGLALAGAVVSAVSGRPYEDFVRETILSPLAMEDTFVAAPPPESSLATGYLLRRSDGSHPPAPDTDARGLTPAANFSSTVRDLARFVSAHLAAHGGTASLLAPTTLREMHRVHWLAPGWTSGRGLGFSVWREGDRTLVGHGGWVAGHRSQIAFDPATGIGVIVLTNSDEGGPGSYVEKFFALVAPAIEKALAPREEAPPLGDPAALVGSYHNPWGEVSEVLVVDGGLVIYDRGRPPAEDPEASLTHLTPAGQTPEGHPRFRIDGGPRHLVFELGEEGRVERIKVDENYLFPADCGTIGPDLRCGWR